MIDFDLMRQAAAEVGITLSDQQIQKLDTYAALLVEWNEKMNLTAITDPHDVAVKHFADSLSAAPLLPSGKFSLVDVGTGAGFPSVPLAIVRPDMQVTLLDSLNKRLVFLQEVCRELGLSAVTVHARAEEGARRKELREKFDVATARAVAALPTLSEYCLPYVKVGGQFLAMKGPGAEDELTAAKGAIKKLGGGEATAHKLRLPPNKNGDREERVILCIGKQFHTAPAYPRQSAKIAKDPLK